MGLVKNGAMRQNGAYLMGTTSKPRDIKTAKLVLDESDGTVIVADEGSTEYNEIESAGFDPDGNDVQNVGSAETVTIELPAKIYRQYSKHNVPVWHIFDCRNLTPEVAMKLISNAASIAVQKCTVFHVSKTGADHFYTEVSEDGLTGEGKGRGPQYSRAKFLAYNAKRLARTITDEELEYMVKHKAAYNADIAEAQKAVAIEL
jgi:hypothetical protein